MGSSTSGRPGALAKTGRVSSAASGSRRGDDGRRPAGPDVDLPDIRDAPAHHDAPRTVAGPHPAQSRAGADLADVLTSHRADVTRIAGRLRLAFLGVLVLASTLDAAAGRGASRPLAAGAILAGYGLLALVGATPARHLPEEWSRTRIATALLGADLTVVVALQVLSDGSPVLAAALFLIPMAAAFQLPVRHTAVMTGLCLVVYLALLAADSSLRARMIDDHTIAFAALLTLGCLACLAVARQYQERQDRIRQLVCERARLLAEVMRAEERERAVLAELLHDGPLQSVLAVRLDLGRSRTLAAPDDVATARVRLLDISRQLRDLTAALHPLMLEARGIGHVLSLLASTTAQRSGLKGDCAVTVTSGAEAPDPRDGLVFTAARELLVNVVLHAAATAFEVSLTDEAGIWHLTVRDDGRGIAPGELRGKLHDGHIGLASLRIRVEAAGGTMTIASGPRGTSVAMTFPPRAAASTPCGSDRP